MAEAKPSLMSRLRMPTKVSRAAVAPAASKVEATGIAAAATTTSSASSSAGQRGSARTNGEQSRQQGAAAAAATTLEQRAHSGNGSVRRRTPSPQKGPELSAAPHVAAATSARPAAAVAAVAATLASNSNQVRTPTRTTGSSAVGGAGDGAKSMFHSSSVIRQPAPAVAAGRKPVGHMTPVSATRAQQPQQQATSGLRRASTPGTAAAAAQSATMSGRGSLRAKATAAYTTPTVAAVATLPRTSNAAAAATPLSSGKLQHASKGREPAAPASSGKLSALVGKPATPANAAIANSSAALSGKKHVRSASLKGPSKQSPVSSPNSTSPTGIQSLKNRAKSLKLPGRNRQSPVPSEPAQSNAAQVKDPARAGSIAGDESPGGGGGRSDVTRTPAQHPGNNVSRLAQPVGVAKTPRFAFGFSSRSQPTPPVPQQQQQQPQQQQREPSCGGGGVGGESSPAAAAAAACRSSSSDMSDETIRLLSYDHSPARKLAAAAAAHSSQDRDVQLPPLQQRSSPGEEPVALTMASCPPAISSVLESTATEEARSESAGGDDGDDDDDDDDDEAEIQSTLTPDATQELAAGVDDGQHRPFPAPQTAESRKPDSPHVAFSSGCASLPPSAGMKKKLSFSPSTEFPVGLTDASPTLPYPTATATSGGGGEANVFDSIAPMSLLGAGAQQVALCSLSSSHGQASTTPAVAVAVAGGAGGGGGRSSARVAAQKQDTMPYKMESRRRSGSAGDCILFSTRSPSPPSSPVLDHHGTLRLKSPCHSSLPRVDSAQDIAAEGVGASPKQTSSYFRHAVAMARTPTSSLKDARLNALSGSTGSLSLLSASKLKNSRLDRSPSGPYVILEIETFRHMQSEIKNLKSSLLQLKRLLQQGEDDSVGIPHHSNSTPGREASPASRSEAS